MLSPRMAIAPFASTRCCASSVMTYRALQIQSADSARSAAAKRRRLKIRDIEWLRKQFLQPVCFYLATRIYQRDLDIAAELPQDLPAGAARRSKHVGVRRHRHPAELANAFRD